MLQLFILTWKSIKWSPILLFNQLPWLLWFLCLIICCCLDIQCLNQPDCCWNCHWSCSSNSNITCLFGVVIRETDHSFCGTWLLQSYNWLRHRIVTYRLTYLKSFLDSTVYLSFMLCFMFELLLLFYAPLSCYLCWLKNS